MWSPMAEISTLFPQLEHLMVGKKPTSIVAMIDRRDHGDYSGGKEELMLRGRSEKEVEIEVSSLRRGVPMAFRGKNRRIHQTPQGRL